jgi:ribosome biogenesis GTP-binding protein YsxC/EngB
MHVRCMAAVPLFPHVAPPEASAAEARELDLLLRERVRLLGTQFTELHDIEDNSLTRVEVAVVGRSNVGKSSLVNALLGQPALSATSRQPGRTTDILFFGIGTADHPRAAVVDMPGYGFARRSKKQQADWTETIAAYLQNRPREVLKRVLLLVDARMALPRGLDPKRSKFLSAVGKKHGTDVAQLVAELGKPVVASRQSFVTATKGSSVLPPPPDISNSVDDCEVAEMLEAYDVPWSVVFTKADLLSAEHRGAIVARVRETVQHRPRGPFPVVYFCSSTTGEGVDALRRMLGGPLGFAPLPVRSTKQFARRTVQSMMSQQQERSETAAAAAVSDLSDFRRVM